MSGPGTLVILRHGESTFNAAKVFTGLLDADVTEAGLAQVEEAARLMVDEGMVPDVVVTSPMLRAVRTTDRLLAELTGLGAIPSPAAVPRRVTWRLVERDYGVLTGVSKAESREILGEEAFFTWRRTLHGRPRAARPRQVASWTDPPPVADSGPLVAGSGESLADVIERVRPVWEQRLVPFFERSELHDDGAGPSVQRRAPQGARSDRGSCAALIAHGNTLRALSAVIDQLEPSEVEELNIPAGHPLAYEVRGGVAQPRGGRYLDGAAAQLAASIVAAEGGT
ncbi:MAG TPA: 2,3-bisphosphoglycerate-dependent phosphoglycerate mutase [Actinomycetaceae bacterium]|nr:2,3-bisphosphoglycerate-dependent phosphoglycerate mutase [Actinomycetaceae bacterium]